MNPYHDQPTGRLENEHLILDYLLESGPRVVRLIPKALGENLLAELPEDKLDSPHGPYRLWGGHRLWRAPESRALTYVPDDGNLRIATWENGVTLSRDDALTGMHKALAISLDPDMARVRLSHRLTNGGAAAREVAPWAITQLRPGGTAVLPTGGATRKDDEGLLPDRLLVLWPYSRWNDRRFRPGDEAIEIDTLPIRDPFKLGLMSHAGWIAYRFGGLTFTKRWTPQPEQPHADFGCNVEVYTVEGFIELETLGPLVRLAPGEWVEHVEEWEVEE